MQRVEKSERALSHRADHLDLGGLGLLDFTARGKALIGACPHEVISFVYTAIHKNRTIQLSTLDCP